MDAARQRTLDIEAIVSQAVSAGCDAVHPGYGFLSENPSFAEAVEAAGMVFVGPTIQSLSVFGDKAQARALAEANGVPVLDGLSQSVSETEAAAFFSQHAEGGVLLKAIAGGWRSWHAYRSVCRGVARRLCALCVRGDGCVWGWCSVR